MAFACAGNVGQPAEQMLAMWQLEMLSRQLEAQELQRNIHAPGAIASHQQQMTLGVEQHVQQRQAQQQEQQRNFEPMKVVVRRPEDYSFSYQFEQQQELRSRFLKGQAQIVEQLQLLQGLASKPSRFCAHTVPGEKTAPVLAEDVLERETACSSTSASIDSNGGLERSTSSGSNSSRGADSFQSLREVLDHLHCAKDPETVVAVRNVRALGPHAGAALRAHFQEFAPVEEVYTHPKQQRPGSKATEQPARCGDLAFVVMASKADAQRYLALSDVACVGGSLVYVAPFLAGLRKVAA